ncbi:MAG: ribonuclease R [Coriobacteriia bacterium]|nr:ribonuclease R [Coriobacteriia bacterium]
MRSFRLDEILAPLRSDAHAIWRAVDSVRRKDGRSRMAKPNKSAKNRRSGFIVGRISITRRGYGFVAAEHGDYYVGARDTNGAMHGDMVSLRPSSQRGREGRSGTVVRVLERATTQVVGRFERHGAIGIVVPSDRRIRTDVFIANNAIGDATPGDIVVARLVGYPSRTQAAQGVIDEIVGREDDPGMRIEIIIREHGLHTEFPEEASAQAAQIALDVDRALAAEPERRDIRDRFTFTIDPVDARDFDDAITIEHVDGLVRLGVHIADVSHYVPWDSPIDSEARQRATSVYLVDRVLPMLPEKLSNEICSLNPGEDRLSFTVDIYLDAHAHVERYELYPSAMRSDRRFNYAQVQRMLDGEEAFPDPQSEAAVRDFARVAQRIGEGRVARGGLDFETVEAKLRLAEDGTPLEVVVRERTQATNMIEEAMILANEVVAGHMSRAKVPMVYRIHEDPDPDALGHLAQILKEFDYPVKDTHGASPATFQRIIKFAHNRPEKRLINSLLLRALERARYVDYLGSHFGLASEAYTHFTSPIRRYPDLIVHRLLRAQLTGTLETDRNTALMVPELTWLTEHSSFMEREAEMAEDDSVKFKLTELMAEHVGEVFDAFITGVTTFGLFVQLENTAEGLVHVDRMRDDHYRLDATKFLLYGEDRGRVYRLGQPVRVRLVDASVSESRLDFEMA